MPSSQRTRKEQEQRCRTATGFLNLPDLAERIEAADEYCYAIFDGECIKVGKSCNHPVQRVADLQTGNPRRLQLIAWTVSLTEQMAHRRLSQWRTRGEWFACCPELLRELITWTWLDQAMFDQAAAVAAADRNHNH